jgi:hypothetical protein
MFEIVARNSASNPDILRKGASVLFTATVEHADVGEMVQRRSGLSFAMEPIERLMVSSDIFWQEREGDEAQPGILGLTDNTHPATTEFLDDAVMRDSLADERIGA